MKRMIRIEIYPISDVAGYKWELSWHDGEESWSEEVATDEDLVDRMREIFIAAEKPDTGEEE